jgi:type I restriction enzyme S subunit
MLSSRNILDDKIIFSDFRYISQKDFEKEVKRTPIKVGDVLLTIVGTIGRSTIVKENTPKFVLQRSVALIKTRINPNYLSYFFRSPDIQFYFLKNSKGTAQKGIYLNQLKKIPIALAPKLEQRRIIEKIEKLFLFADQIEETVVKTRNQAEAIEQSILAKAFRGELVPQDPNDEPASVLFERIKRETTKKK